MASIVWEGSACTCCVVMMANGDDSGCKSYYGHQHDPASEFTMQHVLAGDEVMDTGYWKCDGCGDDMLPFAERWPVARLA